MNSKIKFSIIIVGLLLFNMAIVSASDINNSDITQSCDEITNQDVISKDSDNLVFADKKTPTISVNTTSIKTGGSMTIYLKDSNTPISNQNVTAKLNNVDHILTTDSNGAAILKIGLKPNNYLLSVNFLGSDDYNPVSELFNISVLKANSILSSQNTTVIKNTNFVVYLTDEYYNVITNGNVTLDLKGLTYAGITDSLGRVNFEISEDYGRYSVVVNYYGNDYYNPVSKTFDLIVPITTSVVIGNERLLTNGYLRIYLKSDVLSAVAFKTVIITVGGNVYRQTTSSEGFVVFKPNAGTGSLDVSASFEGSEDILGSYASKSVSGISGSAMSPVKNKIPLRNGVPDIDLMSKKFVLADEDMTYTLTKAQYKKAIKIDSYCLYLNNRLSKYAFFKSKSEPKYYHVIAREKWNVIEREINTNIVLKNQHDYWPSEVTVSLKGKSYTYSEVRDVQNTDYTCGPTSASMCSQVLRNYYAEKYLASKAGSTSYAGTATSGLKKALENLHFKCAYFYKSSFKKALKHLKKGGCALIFHTWSHYVAILDISSDGKRVLVGNPSGSYDEGSHSIPTNWLKSSYMKKMFNNYDTSSLIVKLKYSLSKSTTKKINNLYSSFGTGWVRQNVNERIPQI